MILKDIWLDVKAVQERDPAARSALEVLLLYQGVHALIWHRFAHWFYKHHMFFIARLISQIARFFTLIEIHPGAQIGENFFIDHGNGVIIGETAIVGNNVTLYQGVTLGGTGKEHGKRHPTIGDNVMISAGAKVLGSFTIGENSKIGAGSVVLEAVPPNCTVVGVPGRIVKRNNQKLVREDMNQVDLPDPVNEDIKALQHANSEMTNRIIELERELKMLKKSENR